MYQIWWSIKYICRTYFPNYIQKKNENASLCKFFHTIQRCRGYIQSFEYDLLMMENWMENSIIFLCLVWKNLSFFFDMFLHYFFFFGAYGLVGRNYTFLMFL